MGVSRAAARAAAPGGPAVLASLIHAVVPRLSAGDKDGAIRELLAALKPAHPAMDWPAAADALLRRERTGSTAIGNQVAIPHAKWDGGFSLAIGISPGGMEFDAVDGKKVHLLFLLLAPRGHAVEHLKVMARISRLASDGRFRESLKSSCSPDAILGIIGAAEGLALAPVRRQGG